MHSIALNAKNSVTTLELPYSALNIALLRGLYLRIIMDRHEGPHTALTVALLRGLYLAITMDRHEGPDSGLSIA
jgi:hypothetical protein